MILNLDLAIHVNFIAYGVIQVVIHSADVKSAAHISEIVTQLDKRNTKEMLVISVPVVTVMSFRCNLLGTV
jgi:hypothetical protein